MAHEWNAPPPRPQNWLMDGTKVPRTTVYCGAVQVAGDLGPGVAPRRRMPLGQKLSVRCQTASRLSLEVVFMNRMT